MNIAKLILGIGAGALWGANYNHGNWVGRNWSAGEPHRDGDPLDENVEAINPVDAAARTHDIEYNNAFIDHRDGRITSAQKRAREHAADVAFRSELEAIDPSTLSAGAAFAQTLALLYFGAKVALYEAGAPSTEAAEELRNGLSDNWEESFGEAEESPLPPPCPLVLDLNGDGTGSVSLAVGTYFDHTADGFAETTGWVSTLDGLLVWDRDGSGWIEGGRELFGNQTMLQNGQLASNGFVALAEWDGNADGQIDASDSVWGVLQVWKDVDSDGLSAANELLSMAEAGVHSINLAYSSGSGLDANGNDRWLTGSFTRTDATTGEVTDYRFATDTVRSIATEWLEVPTGIASLPDVSGFGKVYNLHQAMVRDTGGTLQALVEDFAVEGSIAVRNALIDQILLKWADAESVDPASRGANIDAWRLVALEAFMGRGFVGVGGSANPNVNAAAQLNTAYTNLLESVYAQLMAQTHLSDLYAQISYSWDASSQSLVGDLAAVKAILVANIVGGDGSALLVGAEFVRTVRGMGAEDTLDLNSFQETPALAGLLNGPFGVVAGGASNDTLSSGTQVELVIGMAGDDSISTSGSNDIVHGGDGNDTIILQATGSYGGGAAYGGAGNDTITVASTHGLMQYQYQTMAGGRGNDVLNGSVGYDTYLYGRGDGADTVTDGGSTADKIVFGAGIVLADVAARRVGNDMELRVADPGNPAADDRITIKNWFSSTTAKIEQLQFADGATLTLAQMEAQAAIITGTEGNDSLVGFTGNETYHGLGGNDTIQSGGGNDIVHGGAGDDTISDAYGNDVVYGGDGNDTITLATQSWGANTVYGEAGNDVITFVNTSYPMSLQSQTISGGAGNDTLNGSVGYDTYLYGRGDGADTVTDGGSTADKIVFGAGIVLADVAARRVGNDMELRVADPGNPAADDRITIKNWYLSANYRIERLDFVDGTFVLSSSIFAGNETANTLTGTTGVDLLGGGAGNDIVSGGAGNDVAHGGDGDDTVSGDDGNDLLFGDIGNDNLTGGAGSDYLSGDAGNDIADGGTGNDVLQDLGGDNQLLGGDGSDLLAAGSGADVLNGGDGNDLLAGGAGNDTLHTGAGNNVIAYNAGGGIDTVYTVAGASNTLSFGGGIGYDDLSLSKDGNDLVVSAGTNDRVVLKDWYSGSASVLNLQIILDATAQFDANSSDPLYNRKVQTFDFAGLVGEFDDALAQSPGLTSWAVTNALLAFHLSGVDDEAVGGDLAYWYGKNNGFGGIGLTAAQQVIDGAGFGSDAQTLRPFTGLQEGLVKLS